MPDITGNIISNTNITPNITNSTNIGLEIKGYISGGVTNFWEMNDTPNSYLGKSNYFLLVNNSENGIKFAQTVPISSINNLQDELNLKFNTSEFSSNFDANLLTKTTDNLTEGSTNLYLTLAEKSKLAGIEAGAEVNVKSDYNATSGDAEILNKPDITSISRQAISETVVGLDYNNSSGVLSLTNGYIIPTLVDFNNKVDKELNKGLSANDFTDTLKSKLEGVQSGAQVNTVNSVNSKTGNVSLTTTDISQGSNEYYTDAKVDSRITAQKGVVDGIASLDSTGKVPFSQLPSSGGGGITYMGTWDASTGNFPTLTPNDGEFWVISVFGTIDSVIYAVGDWIIYDADTSWSKVPSGSAVSSVNGKTGTVVLSTSDISEGSNEYYTNIKVSSNADVIKGVSANTWGNHALAGYANDLSVVHTSGNETIYDNKTFDDEAFFNKQVAIGSNEFDLTNPEFLKVDGGTSASVNIISAYSNYDDYVQLNIKNNNEGEYASSDFVATADIGQEGSNYIDFGINNSNYDSPEFTVVKALDGYAFVEGGDFALGTATSNKNLKFFTGGSLEENIRAELSDTEFQLSVDISANNLSGTNTGDETNSTIKDKLGTDLSNKLDYNGNGSNLTGLTKTQVGLSNADNTSDLNKPVSTATQTEIDKLKSLAIAMAIAL